MPFGVGKRYCIGEALAKVTLLYFTAGSKGTYRFINVGVQIPDQNMNYRLLIAKIILFACYKKNEKSTSKFLLDLKSFMLINIV